MNIIKKLSCDNQVDLDNLSVEELYQLHFEEESFVAKEALKLPPFSNERNALLAKGEKLAVAVMKVRHIKECGEELQSLGSSVNSFRILSKHIKKTLKKRPRIVPKHKR
jgi:hypothetical protein